MSPDDIKLNPQSLDEIQFLFPKTTPLSLDDKEVTFPRHDREVQGGK